MVRSREVGGYGDVGPVDTSIRPILISLMCGLNYL
jgi:hypothetical protein